MDPRPYTYQYRKPRLSNPTFQSGRLYQSIYHIGSYAKMNPNLDKINNNYVLPSQPRFNSRAYQDPPKERYTRENSFHDQPRQNERYMQEYVQGQIKQPASSLNNYQSSRYGSMERRQPSNPYPKQQPSVEEYRPKYEAKESTPVKQTQPPRESYERRSNEGQYNNQQQSGRNDIRSTPQPRSYSQDTRTSNSRPDYEQAYMSNYGSRLMRAMPGRDQDFVYERQQKPYNIISCYPKENPSSNAHRIYPKFTLESKLIEHGQYPSTLNPERY